MLSPYKTNEWSKLLRLTQFLLSWFYTVHVESPNASKISEHAKRLWLLSAMPDTVAAIQAGRLRELDIQDKEGLKVVKGRASVGMMNFFGQGELPVLMASTRIAYLIMLDAHCQDHAGRDITISTSRHTAWIINAKQLAKRIVRNCIRCRFLRKVLETQKMACLPESLQIPAAPFTNVGIDLIGPIKVHG